MVISFGLNSASGEENMAEDERLVREYFDLEKKFGNGLIILRLYQWKPFCISIGFHQSESHFDIEKIKREGLGFVRRPTGGRAVFHADELTYSVIEKAVGTNAFHYEWIHRVLADAFLSMGIKTDFQKTESSFQGTLSKIESAACFSASARYELEIEGKKLVGSAQRRYQFQEGDVLLQHGSILLSTKHQELADYLVASKDIQDRIRKNLSEKTIALSELNNQKLPVEKMAVEIKHSFERLYSKR